MNNGNADNSAYRKIDKGRTETAGQDNNLACLAIELFAPTHVLSSCPRLHLYRLATENMQDIGFRFL